MNLKELTEKVKKVQDKYSQDFPDVKMDRDYIPFKITEEWGECMQAYLMLTDRGRQKGMSKAEIKGKFEEEFADVFAYLLLLAEAEGIDPIEAVEKKWFAYLERD